MGDPQQGHRPIAGGHEILLGPDQGASSPHSRLAISGKTYPGAGSDEQLASQYGFKLPDGLREGGLAHSKMLRSATEMQVFTHGHETRGKTCHIDRHDNSLLMDFGYSSYWTYGDCES
ncbi:hypothetical protein GCM10025781_16340 [Kocuria gwangalliensis]|uniref:Uncharacterized protein n=1 Tax=Kocuria gwangalliensis TaxID=501592 RepID=A0ABP8X0Z0_9MICC